ncbi:MAG: class I SAM-dependent methyltransferase [Candidatus Brocadiaceae bacterium]
MSSGRKAVSPTNDFGCIADMYDELVAWAPYGKWVDELEERLLARGLRPGDSILDAACGTGLSAVPWARKGYRVVGADISRRMLRRARRRARDAGCRVEFIRQDVTELHTDRAFDAVICMHSGLDYILDSRDLRRAFACFRGCLRQGGLLAFDKCLDVPSFYREDYVETRDLPSGSAEFHYRWDRARRLFEQRCIVRRDDGPGPRRTEVVYHLRATVPSDLIAWLDEAGFETLDPVREFTVLDPGMGIFRAV